MILLRSTQAPSSIFVAESCTSATCMVVGIPAIWIFGMRGAVAALLVCSIAGLIAVYSMLHRRIKEGLEHGAGR